MDGKKDLLLFATELSKKKKKKHKEPDPSKSITPREHYILFLENKDKIISKTWKMKNCKEFKQ